MPQDLMLLTVEVESSNIQHLRKGTAAANESRHRLNDDQWAETKSVDHPSSSQASPTELRTAKQTLSTGQNTIRRGRVVKPPDRLCL